MAPRDNLNIFGRMLYRLKKFFFRRLTPAGRLMLIGLAASALFGLDTNRTTAYQMFTLMAAIMLFSFLASRFCRPQGTVLRILPRYATSETKLPYQVEVSNHSHRPQSGWWVFENFSKSSRAKAPSFTEVQAPTLFPGQKQSLAMELTPRHRGRLTFPGLVLAASDPFGLIRSETLVPSPASLLVLPKRYPLPALNLPGRRRPQPGGVVLAGSIGDSEEFVSLRDYRPGDPLRNIHWRSWAKTGTPVVKEHQEEYFVRHALILDTFAPKSGPAFEEAVSLAASFVATIDPQETLLDLMFVGAKAYCFSAGRRLAQVEKLLEILAGVDVTPDRPFKDLLPQILDRMGLLSSVILVLIDWDEDRRQLVSMLESAGMPNLVLVVKPKGLKSPKQPSRGKGRIHFFNPGRIEEGLAKL